ncbi:hypothetical protein ACFTWD_27870 [Streptomyces sp. NPDC056943]|uniref:hypothetical protein n=1 Tax=Streptomyces sp. NPDC056943 TaxID=3345971 RepID=UPI00362BEE75
MILDGLSQPPRAIHRIADALLYELQAYGRLTSPANGRIAQPISTYVDHRATDIHRLLLVLERKAGLRFAPEERIPFAYYRSNWPTDAPPAGYTTDSPAVRPSTLAASLLEGWLNRVAGSGLSRLAKAAVWQMRAGGLQSALTLVFDLHASGFASGDDMGKALALLVLARSQSSSDEEAVAALIGTQDAEAASWPDLHLETGWLAPGKPTVDTEIMDALLVRGAAEIDRVRGAADYDQWYTGQVQLHAVLSTISGLVDFWEGHERLSLAWRARLKQWEEIRSDSMAFVGVASLTRSSPSWHNDALYMNKIRRAYEARGGTNWRSRFCRERLLVPDRLRSLVLEDPQADLPAEWQRLSRRTIRPWMAAFSHSAPPDRCRAFPCPPERLVDRAEVQAAFDTLGVGDHAEQLRLVRAYLNREPVEEGAPPFTRRLREEEQTAGVPVYLVSLGLVRADPEQTRTLEVLNDVLPRAQKEFITEELQQWPEPEAQLRTYPYAVVALNEAVRQRLDRGETERALDGLVDYLVLEPTYGVVWGALAALLRQMGHDQEARLAEACERSRPDMWWRPPGFVEPR